MPKCDVFQAEAAILAATLSTVPQLWPSDNMIDECSCDVYGETWE